MSDQLFQGRRFRVLTLVDNFSRESLALRAAERFRGDDVVQVLEEVSAQRGLPRSIRVDNGPEFISKSLDWWAYFNGVKLDFSRPGKPTDNAFIESFNGKFRQECLNQHWFLSLRRGPGRDRSLERGLQRAVGPTVPWGTGRRSSSRFFQRGLAPAENAFVSDIPGGSDLGARSTQPELS